MKKALDLVQMRKLLQDGIAEGYWTTDRVRQIGEQLNRIGKNQHTKSKAYPDKDCSHSVTATRYGTSADYLMARLIAAGVDVVAEIGPSKQFESVAAAARHYRITKERQRYEVNPDVNVGNAAARIVEVLGTDKAAELVAAMTLIITTDGSN